MRYLLLLTTLLLVSCAKEPISVNNTNNKEIQVSMLFEFDGCRVYRFADAGRAIYFTNCKGSTQWTQQERHGTANVVYKMQVLGNEN